MLACTFCSVRMLTIWAVTPSTVPRVSRPASGVPMLTAMMMSAPMLPRHIDRQVVDQAAVAQDLAVHLQR